MKRITIPEVILTKTWILNSCQCQKWCSKQYIGAAFVRGENEIANKQNIHIHFSENFLLPLRCFPCENPLKKHALTFPATLYKLIIITHFIIFLTIIFITCVRFQKKKQFRKFLKLLTEKIPSMIMFLRWSETFP